MQTVDGWTLRASLTDVTINSVPNMAGTPYSREGFVSGLATLTIEGNGAVPVKKADLRLWAQFGCQSDIRAGMNVQSGGLVPSLGSLSIVDFVGPILGGNLPVIGGQLEPTTPNPAITGTVQPGNIFRAKLAEKEMTDPNNTKVVTFRYATRRSKSMAAAGRLRCDALMLVGAGLPSLPAQLADATSYAERLYDYRPVGLLDRPAAVDALTIPTRALGVDWDDTALAMSADVAGGYPYFLQAIGKHVWDNAINSPISADDVGVGMRDARREVDDGLYRSRWERATPAQRDLLRALADQAGDGAATVSALASRMRKSRASDLSVARNELIKKGPGLRSRTWHAGLHRARHARVRPSTGRARDRLDAAGRVLAPYLHEIHCSTAE